MPNNTNLTPIQVAWLDFIKSVHVLLVPRPDDRPLDNYLAFRDRVIKIVQGQRFLNELNTGWIAPDKKPDTQIAEVLILELESFSRAIEVAQATEKAEGGIWAWAGRWLGRASTVTDSVKDILEDLPPYAKMGLTLFRELIDIFRGEG